MNTPTHKPVSLASSLTVLIVFGGLILGLFYLLPKIGLEASLIWGSIIAGIGWLISNSIEKQAEYRRLLADEKRTLYFEFLDIMVKAMALAEQGNEDVLDRETWRRSSLKLGLVASDDVVHAFNSLRNQLAASDKPNSSTDVVKPWARLFLTMRRDCGHLDTKLKPSDFLATFVNDIEPYRADIDR